jgi:glucan phosphoethanolaminetransferase (alkaline phosphatase superfamily)
MMFNIFTEEIKNTRFILTVLAVSLLALFGIAIIFIIVWMPAIKISEGLLGLLTTILGAVIAIVSVAYNSHFKAQEEAATARVAQEIRTEACDGEIAGNVAAAANPKTEDGGNKASNEN